MGSFIAKSHHVECTACGARRAGTPPLALCKSQVQKAALPLSDSGYPVMPGIQQNQQIQESSKAKGGIPYWLPASHTGAGLLHAYGLRQQHSMTQVRTPCSHVQVQGKLLVPGFISLYFSLTAIL